MERKEKLVIAVSVAVILFLLLMMYFLCLNTHYEAKENENGEWVLSVKNSTALYAVVPEEYNGRVVEVVDLSGFCDKKVCPNMLYVYLSREKAEFYPLQTIEGEIYSYIEYEDHIKMYRYHGDKFEVLFPKTIAGKPITDVDEKCFAEIEQRLKEHLLKQQLLAEEEQRKQEQLAAEEKARQESLAAIEQEKMEQQAREEEERQRLEEERQQLQEVLPGAWEGIVLSDGTAIPLGISAEELEVLCEGQEFVYKKISKGFVTCEEMPLVRRIRSDDQGCVVYGEEATSIWYNFNSDNELKQIVVKWEKGCIDGNIFDCLYVLYGEPQKDWIRYLGVTEAFRWDLDNGITVFWRPEMNTDYSYSEGLLMVGYTEDLSLAGPPEEEGLGTYLSEYFVY